MNGAALALGMVAGVAAAGLVRRASGSPNAGPGHFRRVAPVPAGFTLSPFSYVRGTTLEGAVRPEGSRQNDPGSGLYHVTTNLPAVLAEGRLRSRRELRAAGRQGAGLGGGARDEAPDQVSVGIALDGALRVLRATRMMAQAVHGTIGPEEAFQILKSANQVPYDLVYSEIRNSDDELDDGTPWSELVDEELQDAEAKVLRAQPGLALYEALQTWEKRLAEISGQIGWIDDEACAATVGFTEPASKFARVRPEAIGLVQLAGRASLRPEIVARECELRFRPEDLVLVGVFSGA